MSKTLISALVAMGLVTTCVAQAAYSKHASARSGHSKSKAPKADVWDYWFTVTGPGGVHAQYYNERVEKKQGRLFFLNSLWKKEEGFINQEQLGEFAEAKPDLPPLFYNYHATYRTTETTIDGTVIDGKRLTVRVRQSGKELPIVDRGISRGMIFSQFFPVWVGYHLKQIEAARGGIQFATLLEDNIDQGFAPVHGVLHAEKPDEFATKTGTHKLKVTYEDQDTLWWVDDQGAALKIEMPPRHILIQRADEALAKKFLNE